MPKKTLRKPAPKNTAERVGNTLTPQFPSKGGKCNHHRACFKVVLEVKTGNDTFHHFDEGGAVLFAMQHSRSLGVSATVTGPDGAVICIFRKRTYDVAQYVHRLTEYNERIIGQDKYDQRNKAASAERRAAIKKGLSKVPPKKKVLKKP